MAYITTKLQGGLGNNLFQIFAAIAYGAKYDKTPIFSSHDYLKVHADLFKTIDVIFKNIEFTNKPLDDCVVYYEPAFHYNDIIKIEGNVKLEGYFQSSKYFSNINVYDYLNYNELLEEGVSLHVRRGDYLAKQEFHPVLEMEYYQKAIDFIEKKNNKEYRFFVFSDDIYWCKNAFIGDKYEFMDIPNEYEAFLKMSNFEHAIIANSSFSWWSAFLNKNKNKTIVMPQKWFGHSYKDLSLKDLSEEGWYSL